MGCGSRERKVVGISCLISGLDIVCLRIGVIVLVVLAREIRLQRVCHRIVSILLGHR